MQTDQIRQRLAELCEEIVDCPHSTPLWTEAGVIVIRNQNIRNGRLDLSKPSYTDEVHFEQRSRRALLRAGDLVITREAPMGEVCMVPANLRCCLGQRMVMLRVDPTKCHARFLLYAIQSDTVQDEIRQSEGTGSTVSNLRIPLLKSLAIPCPRLPEQRAIAAVLGALDDKIELNRRMSETLEAMARALFKSWFIDFDPVRAKMAGRDTGLPKEIADLFPEQLVDSELGEIPEGWEVSALRDAFDIARGLSYKGSGLSESGMVLHNLNSVLEGGGYKTSGVKWYRGDFASRHMVAPGDVLVANTEQGHDRLLIGYAARVPSDKASAGLFSHHLYRVRPNSKSTLTSNWIFRLLNTQVMHEVVSGYANGTTVNMLPMDGLQMPRVVAPSLPIVECFDVQDESWQRRRELAIGECDALSALRDTLLPKLISGELRIPDPERFLKEVAA